MPNEASPSSFAVRRLLPEGHSQMLGDLRLPVKLEGDASLGFGVNFLELPSIGLMVAEMVVPPSGSVSSLLG